MGRQNRIAFALASALALSALTAGCGGDSGDDDKAEPAPTTPSTAQLAKDDTSAKSNARNIATQMEVCFVDAQSYSGCALAPDGTVAGEPTGLTKGTAAGQVESSVTDLGYKITSKSKSGNTFVITKDASGSMKRTCTTKGRAGCPSSGSDW